MVRFLNGEEKCRQKTFSFVKKLGEKCRWMRGKNSGVMKREVWTACLSLKRGLTLQQQQKNPISNLFPSKKRRCSWSIASLFFSLCVSSLIVKMFCCISLSPPLQWLWEVCLYGHFKATFAASSVVHFFLFLKLLQHAISHIFRPKVRSKQFFKKNLRVPNASKKGHSKHAIG